MYPDLSYFLHDVIGTNPDNWTSVFKTFGLFLGLAVFGSAIVLYKELKRLEEEKLITPITKEVSNHKSKIWTDIILNSLIGGFFIFKIPYIISNFEEFKEDAAGVVFSSKGNLLIGIIGAIGLAAYHYWQSRAALSAPKKTTIETIHAYKRTTDITFVAAIFGILGARIFSILENLESFWADPMGQLFSGSGLTIYGGVIIGLAALIIYTRRLGIPTMRFLDALAICYIIGYFVGRLGCHFSGDGDWGIAAAAQPSWWFLPDWMWAYEYPNNVADFYQRGPKLEGCEWKFCTYLDPKVYPTPIWESIANALIFAVLWAFRRRMKVAGMIFFTYLIINGVQRWLIETIRVNERYDYLNLDWSQAQYIAVGLIIAGIAGLVYLFSRKNKAV